MISVLACHGSVSSRYARYFIRTPPDWMQGLFYGYVVQKRRLRHACLSVTADYFNADAQKTARTVISELMKRPTLPAFASPTSAQGDETRSLDIKHEYSPHEKKAQRRNDATTQRRSDATRKSIPSVPRITAQLISSNLHFPRLKPTSNEIPNSDGIKLSRVQPSKPSTKVFSLRLAICESMDVPSARPPQNIRRYSKPGEGSRWGGVISARFGTKSGNR
ncbi:hypothetical protein DL98DRAFT_57883 [Cadophora sp. DSE1049]|nr:hypothetical protein DL98DRAFT_57883 [Cadophora sp. DSE1049]